MERICNGMASSQKYIQTRRVFLLALGFPCVTPSALGEVISRSREQLLPTLDRPTSAWVAVQMTEAFGERTPPRYVIRDRDGVYGYEVRRRLDSLGIEEVLTAPQSPWQNAYGERLIGSIRRECLNHFIILNARHL